MRHVKLVSSMSHTLLVTLLNIYAFILKTLSTTCTATRTNTYDRSLLLTKDKDEKQQQNLDEHDRFKTETRFQKITDDT